MTRETMATLFAQDADISEADAFAIITGLGALYEPGGDYE